MVARVRAAGAIVVGKTNVPEFGAGANSRNVVWGATGNPFNPLLNPGGSSGGSAVALATDMLPVCTGSDTGGSLRIPGAINGVVGFRPSPGLVPDARRGLGWTPISVLGPMGRTVADTCLLMAAQAGFDPVDPLGYPVDAASFAVPAPCDLGALARRLDRRLRPVPGRRRPSARSCATAWRPCATCSGRATRSSPTSARPTAASTSSAPLRFVSRYQADYEKDPASLGPNVRANYEMGAKMSLADVAWAHAEQTRIFRRFQQTFRDYDLVLSPTTPVTPFPWTQLYLAEMDGKPLRNYYHWLALTYFITLGDQSGDLDSLRRRSQGHAVRPAGRRPRPRRWRGARRRARDGAGVRGDSCAAPSAAGPRQAQEADAGAEVDRHAPAKADGDGLICVCCRPRDAAMISSPPSTTCRQLSGDGRSGPRPG